MFSRMSKKKKVGTGAKVGVILLIVYLVVVLGGALGGMAFMLLDSSAGTDFHWLAFAIMGFMGLLLSVVGSIFTAQKQLFDAKDNELLLSMPIPPFYILASRLAMLFVLNFAFSALTMIPAGVVWLILGESVTAAGVIFWVLSLLLLPLLSMALTCLLGWVSEAISSRMKRKNLATTVIMAVFFAAYMYFCFNMSSFLDTLLLQGETIAEAFRTVLLPFYYMGRGILEGDLWRFLAFALFAAVPFALVAWLLTRTFLKLITTKKKGLKVVYVEKKARENSPLIAVLKKETSVLLGMPAYLLNCGLGVIMMLLLAFFLVLKRGELLEIAGTFDALTGGNGFSAMLPAMLQVAVGFCILMTCTAAPSVSLEGKNLWLLRSMPVATETILSAKMLLNVLVAGVPGVLTGMILNFSLPMSIPDRIAAILLPAVLACFTAVFGLWCNLKWPRLDWINAATVVKQGGSVIAAILGGMGILMLPVVLYVALFSRFLGPDWFQLLCCLLLAAATWLLLRNVLTRGKERFESLG